MPSMNKNIFYVIIVLEKKGRNMDQNIINSIRFLSVDMVNKANSGHPGLPMGAAPMAYTLWDRVMKHNPHNPNWINRDRFVLSAGHGSALLYSLLYLYDYGLELEDLKNFRQLDSKTPGHPEYRDTKGVEVTTGPLGQGISNAVGMALAEAHMGELFNKEDIKIIDNYTYVLSGDGDLMEGISYEATSLAGTLGLNKLIVLYDSNSITIDGKTDISFTEDIKGRFEALNWHYLKVEDGNDIDAIEKAINEAKAEEDKPTIIEIITEIGYGSPSVQGKSAAHGAPIKNEGRIEMAENLKWALEPFIIEEEISNRMAEKIKDLNKLEADWIEKLREYEEKYPEDYKKLNEFLEREIPEELLNSDEFYKFDEDIATRSASGILINRLSAEMDNLIGGSADLAGSNNTTMSDKDWISKGKYSGSNIHFGIREHGMGAIANGLALYGGLFPYVATFLVFSDYIKPAIRLSALMRLPITYVFTHDSIGVGEDGPTHQPISQLEMLRSIPNTIVFRPADGKETAAGWESALRSTESPVILALTRQNLPILENSGKDALKGGYIISPEKGELNTILIASGSEVSLAIEAQKELGEGVRVVSMPSIELFEKQSEEYKESILPSDVKRRIAIEASNSTIWYRYIGFEGKFLGMESFGASAPGAELFEKFGFTVENIVRMVGELDD